MKKYLLLILILSSNFTYGQNLNDQEIKNNLRLLYKDTLCEEKEYCYNQDNEDKMLFEANKFKSKLDGILNEGLLPNVKWKQLSSTVREFEFESLYKREPNHPSNTVRGFIFFPKIQIHCNTAMPATLIIHKLADNIDDEKRIGSIASALNDGIVMVIYLPEFGPRSKKGESFLDSNFEKFEENILQSVLDIHQSYQVLKSLDEVKKDDIGLMGFSLGGFTSLISAGLDPIFVRYSTNVGGGDLANIFLYKKSGDTTSMTGSALASVDWTVDRARFYFSRFDAITWSNRVANKKILMINANHDELISKSLSIDKLVDQYTNANSSVKLIMHEGTHVFKAKEIGIIKSITQVVYPMLNFIKGNGYNSTKCSLEEFN
jgi:hypothetical protein